MFKVKQSLSFIIMLFLLVSIIAPVSIVKAETQEVQVTKSVSSTTITTKDEVEVKLDITGTPPVNEVQPNDVILIVDKSGSMSGSKITSAKEAAKGFVDLMDLTKHRVGVVDFDSSTTTGTFPLTTDGESAKNYINTIQANGGTDTGYAIRTAMTALSNHRSEAQPVIVLLTDGAANYPDDARLAAQQAKDAGIVFYTVALLNYYDNPDTSAPNLLLKEMATTAQHHHFVLGSAGLSEIYAAIVKEIGIASARNVVVNDVVSPEFEIVPGSFDQNIPRPIVNGNTLTWNFLELKDQTLTFTYKIRPKSQDVTGVFPISSGSNIQYENYLGNKVSYAIPSSNITIKYPKPDITAVTPDKSEIIGGNEITIKGTDFRQGATVTINSVAATNVQVISENEIKATVPAGNEGNAIIRVENTDGQYDEEKHYYFANPIVTSITPSKGLVGGGTSVSINGKHFLPGVKVFFNNIEAATTYLNEQNITAITPPSSSTGVVDVKVVNPDGTEVIVSNGFTYALQAPTITSISPNEGKLAGGDYIYIYGDNFKTGATVKIGGQDVTRIVLVEQTRIRVVVPAATNAGAVDVAVTNPDGQSATLQGGYNYLVPPVDPAPTITSISPNEGKLAGGDYIYIYGDNFKTGATVKIGGQDVTQVVFVEKARIRVLVPAAVNAGTVDVVVTNPDGQSATLINGYTYLPAPTPPAPTITSLSKASGLVTGGEYVTVFGTGFQEGLTATLGGINAAVVNYYNSTQIRIAIPQASAEGAAELVITNPDGQGVSLANAYTYLPLPATPPPAITSLSKTTGLTTGGDYVTINGTGFQQGLTVKLGGLDAQVANFYSATQIRIIIPKVANAAVADLQITNPDGQSALLSSAYTYTIPVTTITSLSVSSGAFSGGYSTFIYGTNFDPNSTVTVNNVPVTIYYYGATQIKIMSMPSADVLGLSNAGGVVPIKVTDSLGNSVTTNFTYNAKPATPVPVITKMVGSGGAAATGPIAGGTYMYFYGTGFTSAMKVRLYDSFNTLVKEEAITNFYNTGYARYVMPKVTNTGTYTVKLVNSDGVESNGMAYIYK